MDKIDQAISALSKPDTELKVDDVLQFLQAHFPLPT